MTVRGRSGRELEGGVTAWEAGLEMKGMNRWREYSWDTHTHIYIHLHAYIWLHDCRELYVGG